MNGAITVQRRMKRYVIYPLQALLVYVLFGFFKLLPLDAASALGGFIGRTVLSRLGINKKVRRNIHNAMPGLDGAAQDKIILGMWDNLGRVLAEYPHLDEMDGPRVEIIGREHLEALLGKSPFLIASGHFSNWEVLAVAAAKQGMHPQLIYRHANNPYVNRLLMKARTPTGGRLARKGFEGARSAHGALRNGDPVAMLIDQKHNRGLPIPFFGRPAMTATAVAELAQKYQAPIVMTRIERLTGANFRITVDPPVYVRAEDDIATALTGLNARLEQWVRAKPAQWLWLHRRWND